MTSPLNVLLVEDHDFTRVTLQGALASRGFAVRAHASPREALADTTDFQVAILDLDLGVGPTGIDLAHALRRDRPQIGLILLTSYADPRLAVAGLPALPPGCAYICKENVADLSSLMEAAFAVSRAPFAPRSAPLRLAEGRIPLTDVQIEVLAAVATGATSAQIAKERGVTPGAIEQTLARICERLNIPRDEGTNQRILLVREYHRLCGNA